MTTPDEFDRRLRAMAHRAVQEMSTTPHVERRSLSPRRRSYVAPLAVAAGVAAAIAIAVPLVAGHSLRGGGARVQQNEVSKPAGTILRDMTGAMGQLRTYHMVIRGLANDGRTPVTVDVLTDRTGGVAETMTIGGTTNALVYSHGNLYLNGPTVVPAEMQAAVGTHWLGMRAPDFSSLASAIIDPSHVIGCLTGSPGSLSTDGVHVVNGARAIRLISTRTSADTTGYAVDVAVNGPAYALHFESDAGPSDRPSCQSAAGLQSDFGLTGFPSHETVDFDQFNSTALVTVPTDVVDAAAIPQPTH